MVLHAGPGAIILGLGLGPVGVGAGFVSLSIRFGDAAGPFRLYGGPLFSWKKGGKTAGSHIRPYASLRVPSLRCPPGAARPTTCFAKSTTRALRLRRRGLRPSPFRTPPLGLLRSHVTGGAWKSGSSRFGFDFDRRSKEPKLLLLLFMRVSSDAANCDFSRPSGGACRGRVRKHPSALAEDARCRFAEQIVGRAGPERCRREGTRSEA